LFGNTFAGEVEGRREAAWPDWFGTLGPLQNSEAALLLSGDRQHGRSPQEDGGVGEKHGSAYRTM